MTGQYVEGNHEVMAAFAANLTIPPPPPSLARLAAPPLPGGLIEGVVLAGLDKAATAAAAFFVGSITAEMTMHSVKTGVSAGMYQGAEAASSGQLLQQQAGSLMQQVGPLVQQVGGLVQQAGPLLQQLAPIAQQVAQAVSESGVLGNAGSAIPGLEQVLGVLGGEGADGAAEQTGADGTATANDNPTAGA
jgi:hypothetical protein